MMHDLSKADHLRVRDRFLASVRESRSLDIVGLATAFRACGQPLFSGFSAVLELRERDRRSRERLASLIGEFDAEIGERLAILARELPDHRYYTLQDVIAGRGYRRVHSAALGAGALMMWHDFGGADRRRYWDHAIATGLLTSLAFADDAVQSDRAFPAGLLHDLGRLGLVATAEGSSGAWSVPALVSDTAGRLLAEELAFPSWLSDTLFSCELGSRGNRALESTVAAACVAAVQFGYEAAAPVPIGARPGKVRQVREALDAVGGVEWLRSRIESMHLAAEGYLLAAFAVR